MSKNFTITMSEEQVRTMSMACEVLMRLHIGQLDRILELPLAPNSEHEPALEDLSIARKHIEEAKRLLLGFSPEASHGIRNPLVSETARIAFDLHQVCRHRLAHDCSSDEELRDHVRYTVDYREPLQTAATPLASMQATSLEDESDPSPAP